MSLDIWIYRGSSVLQCSSACGVTHWHPQMLLEISMGLKLPSLWNPQLFQRRRGAAFPGGGTSRGTDIHTVPVQVHHSSPLCYKPALLYLKDTQQVPKVKCGWLFPQGPDISHGKLFSCSSLISHCLPSVCLFPGLSLVLIWCYTPFTMEAGGSNTRPVLCSESAASWLAERGVTATAGISQLAELSRLAGISWLYRNIMATAGISWLQWEYHGYSRNIVATVGISWLQQEYRGCNRDGTPPRPPVPAVGFFCELRQVPTSPLLHSSLPQHVLLQESVPQQ